jgi:hypothetical protein
MGVIADWGSTAEERAMPLPCDARLPDPDAVLHRAIDVDAPAAVTWRWLCQMRVAPYSYDLIDNLGRRSPQRLTPGLDLAVGQRIAVVFRIVDFERERSITMRTRHAFFGEIVMTYAALTLAEDRSRILVRLRARWPPFPVGALARVALPAGDLVMMRRQLLNFARLAAAGSPAA